MQDDIFAGWANGRVDGNHGPCNVLAQAPTGAGKTVVMSRTVQNVSGATVSIAHRAELVSQISRALAKSGIYHRIIGADSVVKFCITRHIEEFGKTFHDDHAKDAVAGVKTILKRADDLLQWRHGVQVWNIDEAHHVVPSNQWGTAVDLFPNAFGLGFTASPFRADRQPLGRIHGGVFDCMVKGPTMRQLIEQGYLSDYRLIAPTMSIDRDAIPVSQSTGELNQVTMRKVAEQSTIVGDMVENYLRFASGKSAIGFVVDIEAAKETARRFCEAGVKAVAISGKTPDTVREDAVKRFERRQIDVLINVDLFGEGFDVPGVEVVMMGRPTESLGLYMQQFGRALRVAPGKPCGIIIDHVGNWKRHGLPDQNRVFSLEIDERGRPRNTDPDLIPMRRCLSCFSTYQALTRTCPYCGYYDEPAARNGPEFVDGDLTELSPEFLMQLRGQVSAIDTMTPAIPMGADDIIIAAKKKQHRIRLETLGELRGAINMWAGVQTTLHDLSESKAYSLFYHRFGVDVLTAQTLGTPDMRKLTAQIESTFT